MAILPASRKKEALLTTLRTRRSERTEEAGIGSVAAVAAELDAERAAEVLQARNPEATLHSSKNVANEQNVVTTYAKT